MSSKRKSHFTPATILQVEESSYSSPERREWLVHICAVYGGGNSLRFRCPCCGSTHAHGAGAMGGDSNGVNVSPHCCGEHPSFLNGDKFM
jgi:hypothetical protein